MVDEGFSKALIDLYTESLSKEEQELLLQCLELVADDEKYNRFRDTFPDEGEFCREKYPKHIEVINASATYKEIAMLGGNRSGKTRLGAYATTMHATGLYPSWYTGKRFSTPPMIWCGGDTATTCRDIIQFELLGAIGDFGSGMIPKDLIVETKSRRNVPDAVETIRVRHITGGISTIVLKTYEQGRETWQGTSIHYAWIDEECPQPVYTECLMRTMTTQGYVFTTFTPLSGITDLVKTLMENDQNSGVENPKFVKYVSWDDVGHLSEQTKKDLLNAMPPHERDARSKGIPTIGTGKIYPVPESDFVIDPFQIPKHFPRCFGMDVGWNCCVAKDSMVLLPDGTKKPIQDIQIGESVLAFDFTTENLVPANVISTFKGFATNVIHTGISKEQTIVCTDDHPFAHRATPKTKIKFKEIKDIRKRIREFQSVVLPNKWDLSEETTPCSTQTARVIGYLLGDGCITGRDSRIRFAQKEVAFIEDMRTCLQSIGYDLQSYANNTSHVVQDTTGKDYLVNFLKELDLWGTHSHTKFIPKLFFTATKDVIANLLVGLIHTDGSVEGDNIRYYTVSKELAEGVKLLCLRLGIYASISTDTRKRKKVHRDVYRVTLRRPTCLPLLAPKQLVETRKVRKVRTDRLLAFYEEAPPQDIYCITIDHPDHAFICNGFVVSNTAAVWLAHDRETDTVYLYDEYYKGEAEPAIHASAIRSRGDWIPGVIDPASRGRNQHDGTKLFEKYTQEGLHLTPADNAVEAGIYEVWQRLSTGRLKVFSTCTKWLQEFRLYHRDDKGRIVKKHDHGLDATRYGIMTGIKRANVFVDGLRNKMVNRVIPFRTAAWT